MKTKKNKMARKIMASAAILSMLFFEALPLGAQAAILPVHSDIIAALAGTAMTAKDLAAEQASIKKQPAPTVAVSFTSTGGFKNGTPVTATATPGGFKDSPKTDKLYFTWFIQRSGCDLGDAPSAKCDADGDGANINVNDWKVAAAKITVQGTFNRNDASYAGAVDLGGVEAIPDVDDWKKTYDDGEVNSETPNCYIRDTAAGLDYELRDVGDYIISPCPTGWHPACVRNTTTPCFVAGDAAVRAAAQAAWMANAANAGKITCCTSYLDQPGPVPPFHVTTAAERYACLIADIAPCATAGADYPTNYTTSPMETCTVAANAANTSASARTIMDCETSTASVGDLQNYRIETECIAAGQVPACVENNQGGLSMYNASDTIVAHIIGGAGDPLVTAPAAPNVCSILTVLANPPAALPVLGTVGQNKMYCQPIVDTIFSGGVTPSGSKIQVSDAAQPVCIFEPGDNACKHLFPRVVGTGEITGDGHFTMDEKDFWGANPDTDRTNGKIKDEAAVMGLGVNTFTWSYQQGDKVGVIVEGLTTNPTNHNDSTYKIMWAFPTGECAALNEDSSASASGADRAFYFTPEGRPILTAEADLDDCLEENLLEPDDNGLSAFKINMGYTPTNPVNDPSLGGINGDRLTITASPENGINLDGMTYDWDVYWSTDSPPDNETNWHSLTNYVENNLDHSQLSGVGVNSINFVLNIRDTEIPVPPDVFYLKVRARVEDASADGSGTAQGYVIIRVRQNNNNFAVTNVDAAGAPNYLLSAPALPVALCTSPIAGYMCEVGRYEIVRLHLPAALSNVTWTVNNKPFKCDGSISAGCGNDLYLPILGEEGEIIDVVASFVEGGEKKSIRKRFVISKPQAKIVTTDVDPDGAQPKLMGYYKDLIGGGPDQADRSTKVFQVLTGDMINLQANIVPTWKTALSNITWAVDGVMANDGATLSFSADKLPGESYNVSLISTFDPVNKADLDNLRMALYRHWGVSPYYATEEDSATSLQIDVVDNFAGQLTMSNQNGAMASLITHLPQQAFFMLEIIFTALTIIFSMGLLFNFIPESLFQKNKR